MALAMHPHNYTVALAMHPYNYTVALAMHYIYMYYDRSMAVAAWLFLSVRAVTKEVGGLT